jgi:hypothetical protein
MVHCGHVYFLYLPAAAKEKLVVPAFVAADGRVRFFVINTSRTEFQQARPDVAKHVLPLALNDHKGVLTHNSWLACHEVVGGWTVAEIEAKKDCYRCRLSQAAIDAVRAVIKDSRLHSERDKIAILEQWPQ